jgi:hypothetical protein
LLWDVLSLNILCCMSGRFFPEHLKELIQLLRLPEWIVIPGNRAVWHREEAILLLLRRLSYPCRLQDLEQEFGRDHTSLSRCINHMLKWIYERFGHKVRNNLHYWAPHFRNFHEAIVRKSGLPAGTGPVCAFIDGKLCQTCRPSDIEYGGIQVDLQREVFSGHKRAHGIKIQSVMAPNGMILDYFGPVAGRRHDSYMLRKSTLNARMGAVQDRHATQYVIYGDAAYGGGHSHVIRGGTGAVSAEDVTQKLNGARICVEWGFSKVVSLFAFMDFKKNQKLLLQPIEQILCVSVLLTNCHTCCYGSQTGGYFRCQPPSLAAYLA